MLFKRKIVKLEIHLVLNRRTNSAVLGYIWRFVLLKQRGICVQMKMYFVGKWKDICLASPRSVWPPALSLGSARPHQSAAGGTRRQKKRRREKERKRVKRRKKKKNIKMSNWQAVEWDQSDFPNFRGLSGFGVRRRLREKVYYNFEKLFARWKRSFAG